MIVFRHTGNSNRSVFFTSPARRKPFIPKRFYAERRRCRWAASGDDGF